MLIYPAIDLRHGQVVRLRQGERDQTTVYGNDPIATAQAFLKQGAQWLHVIDLDGAFAENKSNRVLIKQMAHTLACRLQSGGGVRTLDDMAELLDAYSNEAERGLLRVDLEWEARRAVLHREQLNGAGAVQ
ncbi:MAG: hypothetical protein HUU55_06640 [Myxococcales bacterium]|nr:hypothetical protein [Myxococcales bacterium]